MRGRLALSDETKRRRQAFGRYLQGLRPTDMSQNDLAKALGIEYYTFISQVEKGHAKLPSGKILPWADAVGTDRAELCMKYIEFYEPECYQALRLVFELWETARALTGRSTESPS